MALRAFVYDPDAEKGLKTLLARGEATLTELKRRIQRVQNEWEPQDDDDPELIVPFEDFFLIFTIAAEDSSVLVLAAVEPQPRI
jgi:hypothetical protein